MSPTPEMTAALLSYQFDHARALERRRRMAALWLRLFGCAIFILALSEVGRAVVRSAIFHRDTAAANGPLACRAAFWAAVAAVTWTAASHVQRGGSKTFMATMLAALIVEGLLGLLIAAKVSHIVAYDRRRSFHVLRVVLGQLSVLVTAAGVLGVALQQMLVLRRFERSGDQQKPPA
ncbi:MAG: hypothetical protein JWM97_999 [Phycisphaerales bacterium]|nr:hypothetical protein [Phycisphaerales bacterium]